MSRNHVLAVGLVLTAWAGVSAPVHADGAVDTRLLAQPVISAEPASDAAAEDARLVAFLDAAFDAQLALSPERMTHMGIKRDYGKLDDYTRVGRDRALALARTQLAEMHRAFDPLELSSQGRVSYRLLERSVADEEERARWRGHAFSFTTMGAPTGMVPAFMINTHGVDSVADAEAYVSRLRDAERVMGELADELLSDLDVTREVDRYIAHPGQATSYKIGQLKIHELRRKAEAALGPKFDLSAFHEAVLAGGSLPLDVLAEQIDEYLARAVQEQRSLQRSAM